MRKGILAIGVIAIVVGCISLVASYTVAAETGSWFGIPVKIANVPLLYLGLGLVLVGVLSSILGTTMRAPGAAPLKPPEKVAPAKREGEIEVVELLKKSFKSLIAEPGFILPYLLPLAVALVLLAHIWLTYGTLTFSFSVRPMLIWIVVYGLAFLITALTATAAIISKAGARARGERLGVGGALAEGIGLVPRLFAASVLVGAVVVGPILLLIALAILLIPSILLVVPLLLAFLWIIPAIYIGVRLALLAQACVLEDLGPVECLKRSWGLTKGNFWLIFVLMLLFGIISFVIGLIPVVGSFVTMLFVHPAALIALTFLYLELRRRFESFER